MDLVVLLEALQRKPTTCMEIEADFPDKDGKPAYSRRALLGPVTHLVQNVKIYPEQKTPEIAEEVPCRQCKRHEFCPCCLLTNSFDAFKELIEDSGFYSLRLYALRDENGLPMADCRVNGNDWEKGAEALRKYVTTGPEAGFESRTQYVVLQTVEKES
jgi:hypothetical protein